MRALLRLAVQHRKLLFFSGPIDAPNAAPHDATKREARARDGLIKINRGENTSDHARHGEPSKKISHFLDPIEVEGNLLAKVGNDGVFILIEGG